MEEGGRAESAVTISMYRHRKLLKDRQRQRGKTLAEIADRAKNARAEWGTGE